MNKRKILLISPFADGLDDKIAYPPLGLLYLAANMGDKWNLDVLNMINKEFHKYNYDYYGISVHSVGVYKEAKRLIEDISIHNPNAVFFVGGAGASMFLSHNLQAHIIPIVGEGEIYFGETDVNDLDNIAFPARHLLPEHMIRYKGNVHHTDELSTTIIATRGCAYDCAFCDRKTHGRKFRKRSPENIASEIREVMNVYGIKWFRFIDDCITLDKKWFSEVCFELHDLGIKWTCLSRADCIDDKLLYLMKSCGCQEIFFGFESGSQKLLNAMKKSITVKENIDAVKMCKGTGITCCAYMMFGFPGEDERTVQETIDFLDTAQPDKSRISTFVPIPGTDVWLHPHKYNVDIKANYEDFWYFDNKDFGLFYHYIPEHKMYELRDKIMDYYDKNFKESWTKPVAISS